MPIMGATELLIVLVLVLIIFGAGKLSDVGSALGKSIRDVRASAKGSEPTADSQIAARGLTATASMAVPAEARTRDATGPALEADVER